MGNLAKGMALTGIRLEGLEEALRGRMLRCLEASAQSAHPKVRPSPADKAANKMPIPYSEDGPLMFHKL